MVSTASKRKKKDKDVIDHSNHKSNTIVGSDNLTVRQKQQQILPNTLQQSILDVFTSAFLPLIQDTARLTAVTQEIKTHLYNRDFLTAFSKPEYLQAYALRWSATRALGYTDIFLKPERKEWLRSHLHYSETPRRHGHDRSKEVSTFVSQDIYDTLGTTLAELSLQGDYLESSDFHNDDDDPSILLQYNRKDPALQLSDTQKSTVRSTQQKSISPSTHPRQSSEAVLHELPRSSTSTSNRNLSPDTSCQSDFFTEVVCIGGGAGAEVTSLSAAHYVLNQRGNYRDENTDTADLNYDDRVHCSDRKRLQITAIDIADWKDPLKAIVKSLVTPPIISPYASQAVKMQNRALLSNDEEVKVIFHQLDVLDWTNEQNMETNAAVSIDIHSNTSDMPLRKLKPSFDETFRHATLVTMMFTLNELFSTSISRTTAFLLQLTDSMTSGSRLLIVDSPGSYSEITIGKAGARATETMKKYPMKWLLDHTLLEVVNRNGDGSEDAAKWVKEESEDSVWYRHGIDQQKKVRYKCDIELENMRYQIHVYRRI